jgi:hypothetical protein
MTTKQKKSRNKILCPRCGEYGFKSKRWIRSSYYPKYVSLYIECPYPRFGEEVTGSEYIGEAEPYSGVEREPVKEPYKVLGRKRIAYYIGHYDSKKYHQQMKDYRAKRRKSRPNGRKWCYLYSTISFDY